MRLTQKSALVGGLLLALMAAAIAIKLIFFRSIKEAYFSLETRSLQRVPAGLAIIRPTHFAFLHGEGILYAAAPHRTNGSDYWIMGRNAPLRSVFGVAFDENPSHVVLPPGAPSGNLDFLVTISDKPAEHLLSAIRGKFGYVATKETRDTPVLALKVANASLPGLTLSGADEKPRNNSLDYEIQFTHRRVAIIARVLDRYLAMPVLDETGLTNFYNFSIPWNSRMEQQLQKGEMDRAGINQMLAKLGLSLEPDTASMEMLVVEKAK